MRVAHCSDLHLLSHDGAGLSKLLNKRWIGAANLLTNRSRHYHVIAFEDMIADLDAQGIDHVLCTGDVTNLALRQEFEFARTLFDRFRDATRRVTVIPGNHDSYVAEGAAFFAEIFAPFCTTDPGWEHADGDPSPWPIVHVRDQVAIIGLSTSRQTPWFTAYGTLGEPQLARLQRILEDKRLAGLVRLVAIHHPPAGKRARSRIRGLRDHDAFARVLAAAGCDVVVHGHEHRDMYEILEGPDHRQIPVRGVPSGTYEHDRPEKTARYRIFEIEGGRITSDHLRVWERASRCFRDDARPTLAANYAT